MRELAIYVPFPFCQKRCAYCDFPSSAGKEGLIPPYLAAVAREFAAEEVHWAESLFPTVFFGGGTPSLAPPDELIRLLETFRATGRLAEGAEVTLEANPGTVDRAKLAALRAAGFNRLSLGVQCRDDGLLKLLGRIHDRRQAEAAVADARSAGFANINLDLIFGLPGQTRQEWEATLKWAVGLGPTHLSCYGLQLEEGTPLAAAVASGQLRLPAEEETAGMMETAMVLLPEFGYEQYEISNYAKPGYACRHNQLYWERGDYLGLGAGACSTLGFLRWSNPADPEAYLRQMAVEGRPNRDLERLSDRQAVLEEIMLGLRLRRGLDKVAFARRRGPLDNWVGEAARYLIAEGWLETAGPYLRLSQKAVLVSNAVIGRLCEALID